MITSAMAQTPQTQFRTEEHVPSGEHGRGFPPFQKESFASQIVWLAICFAALYLIVSRVALPRVGGIIGERRSRVEGDLAEAGRLKAESDGAIAAYEKALADARARAQGIASETRDKLSGETEAFRKTTEEQFAAKLAEAEKTIAATKTAAMSNVRAIAIDAAAAIVTRLGGASPSDATVASAVDGALKR